MILSPQRLSKQYLTICQLKLASTSGDELYTDRTIIAVEQEDNAKTEVNELDVAYWPDGNALCLFYGPTPISKEGKILAYSPVNIIGKIVDSSNKDDILNQFKDGTKVIIREPSTLL